MSPHQHHPKAAAAPASITLIAAVAANGVIGAGNDLVWRDRDDLRRFKALTLGHTLVMGRKTFDSIGRPLPKRRTVVVTRQAAWRHDGVDVAHCIPDAFELAAGADVFVAGGGDIYAQCIDAADRLEITHIHHDYAGDAHFPRIDPTTWTVSEREQRAGFDWVTYCRRSS